MLNVLDRTPQAAVYRVTDAVGAEALRTQHTLDRSSAWAVAQAVKLGYHVELNDQRVVRIGHLGGKNVAMSVLLLDAVSGRTVALFSSPQGLHDFIAGVLRVNQEQAAN